MRGDHDGGSGNERKAVRKGGKEKYTCQRRVGVGWCQSRRGVICADSHDSDDRHADRYCQPLDTSNGFFTRIHNVYTNAKISVSKYVLERCIGSLPNVSTKYEQILVPTPYSDVPTPCTHSRSTVKRPRLPLKRSLYSKLSSILIYRSGLQLPQDYH